MGESEKLLRSAHQQWQTVQKLLKLGPVDEQTRNRVLKQAEACQTQIHKNHSKTPASGSVLAETINLSSILDEIQDLEQGSHTDDHEIVPVVFVKTA